VLKKFQNVAMQAAAMSPIALNEEGVDAANYRKEIAKIFASEGSQPEAMLDNIAKVN
jgi:elongation factor Ts